MNQAFLLIGGNLGDRAANLAGARSRIRQAIGAIRKASAIYETAAWGLVDQPDFYNQALLVTTSLQPEPLMHRILEIEAAMGRIRNERYGPRVIDIDILLYNDLICQSPVVTLPHPRMAERRFVLAPLEEIAPETIHPQLQQTIHQLLLQVQDPSPVKKI
ncbi:2-amino-4-hydroxy-6-hydroxymethyldihydropteridine diphosphokinase [Niabella drilacis]|uniref:2-amino-4-hydroxy-6-hydroxymethyldihydropteridine pyrophosphokinase n=1 Tax=Niabella drilacis (strain DSM 25811 / CCM 8410 / CCUG 62505 / LMG 26954 / E90) TaxID=1285928 RepID=A0A1G6L081_NIADE|nr:2-amino-4-hydroxy-6-hydroxymethyldihydropteridine diphosphokinase [Niabella drilacis]SDC36759.1 2-amino-4-hydroxy-6-hydroxymethyldihydropteridinediphosphokinase [Niabella drilacis]